jgi:hypothetical protein
VHRVRGKRLGLASLQASLRGIAAAAMLGGLLLAGCATSPPATYYTPFTGLRISAAVLFAGYTCGVGPGQVYAYIAVVSDATETGPQPTGLPIANRYACTADGAFQNLPGSGFYNVSIYAYDRAAFPAELACMSGNCALPPTMPSQLGNPTWTTTCTGVVEEGQNALVQCQPLTPTSVSATPDASVAADDGGVADATAADATLAADGAADASVDTGETGTVDGGASTDDGGTDDGSDGGVDIPDSADASDAPNGADGT